MSSYKYVMQDNQYDCGIASLITCFLNMGKHINKDDVLNYLHYDEGGINAYSLINASNKLGIKAKGVKCDIKVLNNDDLPCIAHIIKDNNYYHYIVLLNIHNKDKIEIFDPSTGFENITKDAFSKLATGVYILFNKLNVVKKEDKRFFNYLLVLLKQNKLSIFKTISTSLLLTLFTLASNYYLKLIIELANSQDKKILLIVFTIFLNVFIIKNIISLVQKTSLLYLSNRIDKFVTKTTLRHLFNLPYNFFSKRSSNELTTILMDIENFKSIVIKVFVNLTINSFIIVILTIYMFLYNWYFVVVSLLIFLILIIISYKYQNILNDTFTKYKNNRIIFNSNYTNKINSFSTIKNLHIEESIINQNNKYYKEMIKSSNSYTKATEKYEFSMSTINEIYYLIIILGSIILSITKNTPISDVILFSSLFYLLEGLFMQLSEVVAYYKMYKTSVNRVLDIQTVKEEYFKKTKMTKINHLSITDLKFKQNDQDIITNLNLEINKQEKIFIEGISGIGKSSLIKILMGYYKDYEGKISIDKVELKYLSLEFIRENITYVSQQESLFADTIYNNLKLITESKPKMEKALKTCLIDKIFEDKKIDYNLLLEDNAHNLSGGERGKLLIARGLLKAKSILVLDESFNEMDAKEEKEILENIFKGYPTLTLIVISHHKANKKMFDKVIKLKKEKV